VGEGATVSEQATVSTGDVEFEKRIGSLRARFQEV